MASSTNDMKIIAFGYKKGVGKNTAGKFLNTFLRLEKPQFKIKHISFAAKLKDIAYQLYGWAGLKRGVYYESHRDEKEIIIPKLGFSPRDIWIWIGNSMREIYANTWIDFVLHNIRTDILIITDLRFRNEADAIQKAGGFIVKIDRPNILQGMDPAEVDLDFWPLHKWNYVINNTGTLQDLNRIIEKIAKDLLG